MFVKKKGKKILKLIQIHGEEQRYEVDAFKYKTQRRMGDGGSQKSEAKVEVGNGKSEVGRPSCALNENSFQVST